MREKLTSKLDLRPRRKIAEGNFKTVYRLPKPNNKDLVLGILDQKKTEHQLRGIYYVARLANILVSEPEQFYSIFWTGPYIKKGTTTTSSALLMKRVDADRGSSVSFREIHALKKKYGKVGIETDTVGEDNFVRHNGVVTYRDAEPAWEHDTDGTVVPLFDATKLKKAIHAIPNKEMRLQAIGFFNRLINEYIKDGGKGRGFTQMNTL